MWIVRYCEYLIKRMQSFTKLAWCNLIIGTHAKLSASKQSAAGIMGMGNGPDG